MFPANGGRNTNPGLPNDWDLGWGQPCRRTGFIREIRKNRVFRALRLPRTRGHVPGGSHHTAEATPARLAASSGPAPTSQRMKPEQDGIHCLLAYMV